MEVLRNGQIFPDDSIHEQTAAAALPLTTTHMLISFSSFFSFYCLCLPRYNSKGVCLERFEEIHTGFGGGRASTLGAVSGFWAFAVV